MLSELFQLARNFSGRGIETPLVHPDFDTPGLSGHTTLRVVLDDGGLVARVAPIAKEDQAGLWTLKSGNFGFFPAVRLRAPLLSLRIDDARWEKIKKPSRDLVGHLVDEARRSDGGLDLTHVRAQTERMSAWTFDHKPRDFDHLVNFCHAFVRFSSKPAEAKSLLLKAMEQLADAGDEALLEAFAEVLVGARKEPRQKPAEIKYKTQLCFDYRPPNQPSFTIYTASMRQAVLEILNAGSSTGHEDAADRVCALSGRLMSLQQGPFPGWSAKPVIGKSTGVFSKFSDAACNYRYRRADSDAFSIGESTARRLVGALKQITGSPGRNFRFLHNGKLERRNKKTIETKDVLIVYPSYSFADLPLVDVFARGDPDVEDDAHVASKTFSDAAKPVLDAFDNPQDTGAFSASVMILAIRAISPGQVQLSYSGMPAIFEFRSAIDAWIKGGENLPKRLETPLPSKGSSSGYGWFRPRLLFPEDVSRLLSHNWIRDGTESARVAAPAVGDVLNLFLRKPGVWEATANRLLEIALARTGALVVGLGNILHRDDRRALTLFKETVSEAKSRRDKRAPDYALSQAASLLGSLLYAANSKVEDYMNESAYQMGQLLAAMDELHRCYGIGARDGDVPATLIGNGLLGRAADSPALALEELLDRSRIYLGWAKTAFIPGNASDAKKIAVHSARKLLRTIQPIAQALHGDASLSKPLEATQKAHLFLGYLAPVLGKERGSVPDTSEPGGGMDGGVNGQTNVEH